MLAAFLDSRSYHALVLSACAALWYLTYRTLRAQRMPVGSDGHGGRGGPGVEKVEAAGASAGEGGGGGAGDQTAYADSYKVIQVTVPREAVGTVIGKDGAVIRHLQQSTRTRITFSDRTEAGRTGEPPAEETVSIRGEAKCVHAAETELRRIIAAMPRKEVTEFRLASHYIGRLIGRGGAQVRGLMTQSRCRIDIERGVGGAGDESRVVQLRGTREQIEHAKSLIDALCAELDQRDSQRPGPPPLRQRPRPPPSSSSSNLGDGNGGHGSSATADSAAWTCPAKAMDAPNVSPGQPQFATAFPAVVTNTWEPQLEPQFTEFPDGATYEPIKVCVTAVGPDPTLYFVLCVNQQSLGLETLMASVADYYSGLRPDDALGQNICPGELVAAYCDCTAIWQRAKVLEVLPEGLLDLDCLDYGDMLQARPGYAFRLLPRFYVDLPFQAIRCTLDAELALPAGSSEECVAEFQRLTSCAKYVPIGARLLRRQPDGTPVLQLLVQLDGREVCVTEQLRRQGYLL